MRLYLDLDEVILDSINAVLEILNARYNKDAKFDDIKMWNFNDAFPNMTSDEIEDIFESKEFFDHVKFKDGAESFIEWAKRKFGASNITFVTKGGKTNIYYKKVFIEKYFPELVVIGVPLEDKKSFYTVEDAILIDDSRKNLDDSNCKVNILYLNSNDAEWNEGYEGIYVRSFGELILLLENFCKIIK